MTRMTRRLCFAELHIYLEKRKFSLPSICLIIDSNSFASDDRSFTKNLLIDWERAEILNQKQDEQRLPLTV